MRKLDLRVLAIGCMEGLTAALLEETVSCCRSLEYLALPHTFLPPVSTLQYIVRTCKKLTFLRCRSAPGEDSAVRAAGYCGELVVC